MKRKREVRRTYTYWLYIIILLLGVGLIATPSIYTHVMTQRHQQTATVYLHRQSKQLAKNAGQLQHYNQQLTKGKSTHLPLTQKQRSQSIGFVTIPSIHVNAQPVYYGGDDQTLAKGVGVMPGTSLPIGGKSTLSVLSGHSGFSNQVIFDNIRKLKNGAYFYVSALGQPRHAYRVYKRVVVDPRAKNVQQPIRIQSGKDITVLLTCTPRFINSHRLLVFGKRVPLPTKQQATKKTGADKPQQSWLPVVVIVLLLVGLVMTYTHIGRRQPKRRVKPRVRRRK
jgi:sortase A